LAAWILKGRTAKLPMLQLGLTAEARAPRDWFFSKLPALMVNLKSKKRHFNSFCVCFSKNKKNVFWAAIRSPCSSAMVWPRQEASGPHNLKLGYKAKTAATSGLLFKKILIVPGFHCNYNSFFFFFFEFLLFLLDCLG